MPVNPIQVEVAVIGAGPAGLAAALNLARARRRVAVIDSNRPRHAATLISHGFITRDGVSPSELRRIGREEIESYPEVSVHAALVDSVTRASDESLIITAQGIRGDADVAVQARVVVVATGLSERLPDVANLRAWYGTLVHSCIECDGYGRADQALFLLGETPDLADHAVLLSQWSRDLVVFTHGANIISPADELRLQERGLTVERRRVAGIEGEQGRLTGVRLVDGELINREAGFVRPFWTARVEFLNPLAPATTADGLLVVDKAGRTSVPGLYAAGDVTPPGAEQLLIAAAKGQRVAAAVNRDLIA